MVSGYVPKGMRSKKTPGGIDVPSGGWCLTESRRLAGITITDSPPRVEGFQLRKEVSALARRNLRPGETAPASGQYEITGPRGGRTGEERTVVRGEPLPPTPEAGQRYVLVDRSNNESGRKR